MKPTYALFDFLYLVAMTLVYSAALSGAIFCVQGIWGDSVLAKAAALLLGYFLFLHFFVIGIGLLRCLLQPRLRVGDFPVGFNRDYVAWGINSIFHGIMIASPFASQVFFIFYLNWLYYRLMGMQLPLSTLIGTGTAIRQPELLRIGNHSVIGIQCTISGHHSPNRSVHCHGLTAIGHNTLIGGTCKIMGPVTIGDNVVVGAGTDIAPHCRIGDNSKIGASCALAPGSSIPANVIIKNRSYITHNLNIQPGEIWAGSPAVRIGFVNAAKQETQSHAES